MRANKWTTLISAFLLHFAAGSVYAWSVLTYPLINATGWDFTEVATVFGITIFFLGMTTALLGEKVAAWGPIKSCFITIALFLVGSLLSVVAVSHNNLPLLYLAYGILIGIGTGIAYLVPIPILMTHFPNCKGFATGIVVMGFGFSSVVVSYAYQALINSGYLNSAIGIVGICCALLMFPACVYLRPAKTICGPAIETYHLHDLKNNKTFQYLWLIFVINILVGVALISSLAPMTIDLFNISANEATDLVAIIAIVNGAARIIWSTISDWLGRPLTFLTMILMEFVALISMIYWYDYDIYCLCVITIISCYGGMFATMPGYIADVFGTAHLSKVLGYMLTAWGIAGLLGPKLLTGLYIATNDYSFFFYLAATLMGANIALSYLVSERTMLKIKG